MTAGAEQRQRRYPAKGLVAWVLLFAGGLLGWLLSFGWSGPRRAWLALLISFLYFTSLAGGLVVWLAIIKVAQGRWARGQEQSAAAAVSLGLPSLLALAGLWLGSPWWAPWYQHQTPQGFWLDNTFLFSRQFAALLLFWAMAWWFVRRRLHEPGRAVAAFFIITFCFTFTLLAFDLVMALDYHWHSSLFGGYFFISSLYIAMAAWGLLAACQPGADRRFRLNLGNLLLSFSILTTYLMFCQLLPIWYENLARESRFLYERLYFSPAAPVTHGLLATVYLGPLVLLLTRRARAGRLSLGLISALILGGMWLERWWLVAPTLSRQPVVGLSELSIAAAFAGLLGAGIAFARAQPAGEAGAG